MEEIGKEVAALEEAKRVFKNWKRLDVDWLDMFPEMKWAEKGKTNSDLDLIEDLMDVELWTWGCSTHTSRRLTRAGSYMV